MADYKQCTHCYQLSMKPVVKVRLNNDGYDTFECINPRCYGHNMLYAFCKSCERLTHTMYFDECIDCRRITHICSHEGKICRGCDAYLCERCIHRQTPFLRAFGRVSCKRCGESGRFNICCAYTQEGKSCRRKTTGQRKFCIIHRYYKGPLTY